MSRTPTKGIDYTSKDYESFRNDMLKQLGIKMPEYTDLRQSDAGVVILELLAQGLDVLSFYQDIIANETYLVTAEQRANILNWAQMLSYIPKASTPAEFTQVFVLSEKQTTNTVIPAGTKVKTQASSAEPEIYFETEQDFIIPPNFLGNETNENGEYLYTTKVVQGVSITSELVGSSDGTKDQTFTLSYTPVILSSISIIINEGNGFERWTRVDNFVDSMPTSKHYKAVISDNDEAVIIFGDGNFGKIPAVYENGIYCSYRVGGGTQGNVGAMKINVLDSNLALVDSTFNPTTADVEGQNKESNDEVRVHAPSAYRNKWGALTTVDFAEVVEANFVEIDKAVAYRTGYRNTGLNIYVLLKNDAPLTEAFERTILDMFDENKGGRKLIGTSTIDILPAIKTPIDITATLVVKDRYYFENVKAEITAFLEDYFAVGNYDFHTELSISRLSAEILDSDNGIEGIRSFRITLPTEDILIPEEGVIYTLGDLNITNGGA